MLTRATSSRTACRRRPGSPSRRGRASTSGRSPSSTSTSSPRCSSSGRAAPPRSVMIPRPGPSTSSLKRSTASEWRSTPACHALRHDQRPSSRRGGPRPRRAALRCVTGRPPCPASVRTVRALTGGASSKYGLAETSPLTHCTPIHGERRPGGVGLPLPGHGCADRGHDERRTPATGRGGRTEVRGPQVMLGYWGRPEGTRRRSSTTARSRTWRALENSSELLRVDRDREPSIDLPIAEDRRRARWRTCCCMHPERPGGGLVAGVSRDSYRGETVKAFVVLKPGESATGEEIVDFCRLHLASFKVPRKIVPGRAAQVDGGKYLRRVLVEEERPRKSALRRPPPSSAPGSASTRRASPPRSPSPR